MSEHDDNLLVHLAHANNPTLIKVIGVGGGGGNAVAHMYRENLEGVRYLVCNTDRKALDDNPVPDHLQLGPGLGAGGKPEKGRELAEENIEKIKESLDADTRMVFITAGMGGGTGTGASPIIAHEAKQKGILTVGIVTIPFLFEREKQIYKALDGLDLLAKEVDALLVINNQRLCDIYHDLRIINAFKLADVTHTTAVRSITEIITMHGRINLDFEDVRTVLTDGGVAIMSTGYAEGEFRVKRAIEQALNSPLLNNNDVYKSDRILLAITFCNAPETALRTEEMNEVTAFMSRFDANIETKWGMSTDPSLGPKVKITILASGFGLYGQKSRRMIAEEKKQEELPPNDAEARERLDLLKSDYYPTSAKEKIRQRRRNHCYIFSAEELLDDGQLLEAVENQPTSMRSQADMDYIRKFSRTKSAQTSASNPVNPNDKPLTISFDLSDRG